MNTARILILNNQPRTHALWASSLLTWVVVGAYIILRGFFRLFNLNVGNIISIKWN